MRKATKLCLALSCLALAAPPAAQGSHADIAPQLVFTDPTIDGVVLADATPPYQDLIEGYIGETAATETGLGEIVFQWVVADIPDPLTTGVPTISHYYWDFTLDDPDGVEDPVAFELSVSPRRNSAPEATLASDCVTENNLTTCTPVPGARVTASVDAATNTIEARVRRTSMKDADGNVVAVDGAVLFEIDLFQGIAAYTGAGIISGSMGDQADLNVSEDGSYVLGQA